MGNKITTGVRKAKTWFATLVALLAIGSIPTGAATALGDAAPSTAALPSRPTLDSVQGARWLGVDPQSHSVLVLTAATAESAAAPQLMTLGADGAVLRTYALPLQGLDSVQVHYFPRSSKAVVVTFSDAAEMDADSVEEADEPVLSAGHVWLVDLASGRVRSLAETATSVFADLARERVILAHGANLRIIDVASAKTLLVRQFVSNIEKVALGASGNVYFLQQSEGKPTELVALATAGSGSVQRSPVSGSAQWNTLLGVDESRNRVLLAQDQGLEAKGEPLSVIAQSLDNTGNATQLEGSAGLEARMLGSAEGAAVYALQDAASGRLCIYDATNLSLVRIHESFYGQLLGADSKGQLLVTAGKELQRRDPKTFEIQQSVELAGFINAATLDLGASRLYAVVEAWKGETWAEQLVRLDIESLQPAL